MRRTDTRPFFRPLCADIVSLWRSLSAEDWLRPTLAGTWRVRDVAAHLVDTALRRLSFHRDRLPPLQPPAPPASEREFVAFINGLNATWIAAAERLSPRVLTDLYAAATADLASFVEAFPDEAPGLFGVSWAGEHESAGWLDIGRDFTEIWHHGAQIRDAVAAGPFTEPRWLRAVLEISMHALPHAYRDVSAATGASLRLEISGPSGGAWTLTRADGRWVVDETAAAGADAIVRLADEAAWRLLFNALSPRAAEAAVRVEGDRALAAPLLQTRAVIV
jgi:uncharacterized protein (TIGR03083 family)